MLSRRTVALGLAGAPLAACAPSGAYRDAVAATWRLMEPEGPGFPVKALVHAATLAANSHNTQPWRFFADGQGIRIQPDHHLFASLGCAAETLLQAAPRYGWRGHLEGFDSRRGAWLAFERAARPEAGLAPAIPRRASTRGDYDGRPAPVALLRRLQQAGGDAVATTLITDRARLEQATELIVRGNAAQVRNPAFRRELKAWIRFDAAEAARRRDGLYAASSGNPTLPRALGALAFDLAFTDKGETDKIVRQMRSSAGLAVFSAATNDPRGWLEAGRAYTRFALMAEIAGLRTAFLNQPVEDAPTRGPFAAWLGNTGRRPDLVVRFGQGPRLPRSLRRPLEDVLSA